jgi:hypothetical protein
MEKYTPGNLVGHGKTLQEVRRPIALRRGKVRLKRAQVAQVSPMSRKCRLSRARRANVTFIAQVSRCMRSSVDSTYIAIHAIVRLLRIESLQRNTDEYAQILQRMYSDLIDLYPTKEFISNMMLSLSPFSSPMLQLCMDLFQ